MSESGSQFLKETATVGFRSLSPTKISESDWQAVSQKVLVDELLFEQLENSTMAAARISKNLMATNVKSGAGVAKFFYLRPMSHYRRMFREKVVQNRSRFRRFLTKVEKNPPKGLDALMNELDKEVWQEIDCLACSNCCRNMTPTYTFKDLQRISKHLNMTISQFKEKWLYKDRNGDWMNVSTPCQFLDRKTNMCSIYAVRPADCAGFPHLTKKKAVEYIHVHKQNVQHCPATYRMVEKMMSHIPVTRVKAEL